MRGYFKQLWKHTTDVFFVIDKNDDYGEIASSLDQAGSTNAISPNKASDCVKRAGACNVLPP